jgi:23S rRNA (uracil1939-C5)-methyltransferase
LQLEVEVERILPGGVGLAHADGKTVFVALAAPGDRLLIDIERQQGNVFFASIHEILVPSPVRIEPPCPYFGRCGGCDFQQLNYETQLSAKVEIVRDCLHRIAKLEQVPEIAMHRSPDEWRYRARATWQLDREKETLGYYERASRRVCDVADCAVLVPELQSTLAAVRSTPWQEFPSDLKHLEIARGEGGVSLTPEFADFHTRELELRVGGEVYNYNAAAFFQVNQQMLEPLIDYSLKDAHGNSALDLYCGVGLFTVPLARRFQHVVGIEANPVTSRFARRNLQRAELGNAQVVSGKVGEWLNTTKVKISPTDFVLLDPPRAGAESVVIKGVLALQPRQISYVSCDPATLARDLKKLIAGGYNLDSIASFDMFPQTHHVETVARLSPIPD